MNRNQVTLVGEQDQVIGSMDKFEAHRNPPKLHRAVSVWLINSKGELLFQQRSQHKFTGQGCWANTICGNLFPEESYEECAYRRLKEELGITSPELEAIAIFRYWAYVNDTYSEHEMDCLFVGRYDGEVEPNPLEASDYRWLSYEALQKSELAQPYITAEESVATEWVDLKAKTPTVEVHINGEALTVVPWTAMMWQDQRLHAALQTLQR
jgi:isopentenyl-diphosphate delta-isomerase